MPGDAPRRMNEAHEEKHQPTADERIAALEAALAASRAAAPLNPIPEYGAGDGTDIAETWSQAEQEYATAVARGWPGHPSSQHGKP